LLILIVKYYSSMQLAISNILLVVNVKVPGGTYKNMTNYIKTDGKDTVEVSLDVLLIKDGDYIVSFCPALNLSSFGDTESDAKSAFDEAFNIFIEETQKKGTLEKVLLNLGWQLKKLPMPSFLPPLEDFNPYSKPVQSRFSERVAIPVY